MNKFVFVPPLDSHLLVRYRMKKMQGIGMIGCRIAPISSPMRRSELEG
jgi:hypothetical protein